jgi:hypothetical protein
MLNSFKMLYSIFISVYIVSRLAYFGLFPISTIEVFFICPWLEVVLDQSSTFSCAVYTSPTLSSFSPIQKLCISLAQKLCMVWIATTILNTLCVTPPVHTRPLLTMHSNTSVSSFVSKAIECLL